MKGSDRENVKSVWNWLVQAMKRANRIKVRRIAVPSPAE
jgi:hypothetical protein